MLRKLLLFKIFFYFFSTGLFAQSEIDLTAFLSNLIEQSGHEKRLKQIQEIEEGRMMPGWIEDVEIRTKNRDFDLSKMEYTLRLSPKSRKEIKAAKNLDVQFYQLAKASQRLELIDILKAGYSDWLNILQDVEELEFLKRKQSIVRDKITLLNKNKSLPDFELIQLLECQHDLEQLNLKENAVLQEINQALEKNSVNRPIARIVELEKQSIIPIQSIQEEIAQSDVDQLATNHPEVLLYNSRLNIRQAEYDLELAEANRIVDFFQARHRGGTNDAFRENLSLGVAFRLPLKKNSSLNLNESKREALEEVQDQDLAKAKVKEELLSLRKEILNAISDLENRKEYAEKLRKNIEEIAGKYSTTTDFKPTVILKMKSLELDAEKEIVAKQYKILDLYVDWLAESGLLISFPLQNKLYTLQSALN